MLSKNVYVTDKRRRRRLPSQLRIVSAELARWSE